VLMGFHNPTGVTVCADASKNVVVRHTSARPALKMNAEDGIAITS
jgi:hypothetical protein